MCREQVDGVDKRNAGMESEFEGCCVVLLSLAGKLFSIIT